MNNHEQNQAQFPPLIVDEQIEELLWSRRQRKGLPVADERLVGDLQALYEAANAGTRERVWQRLANRIASNDAIPASYEQEARARNAATERHRHMSNKTLSPFAEKQLYMRHSGIWGIVAAVILAILLVGSMGWIIALQRYHNTGSDMGSSNGVKQQQQAAAPVTYSGVYVQTANNVQRVDAKTGKMIWRYEIPFLPASYDKKENVVSISQFIVDGDTVYTLIAGPGGKNPSALVALKADTGKERWSQPLTDQPFVAPMNMALDDGVIYVEAQTTQSRKSNHVDYTIYSFSAKDGQQGSTYPIPENSYPYAMTEAKNILYLSTEKGLYAVDARSKKQLWEWNGTQPEERGQSLVIREPYVLNGVLYTAIVNASEVGVGQSKVAAFSAENGKLLWQSDTFAGEAATPTLVNGVMYVGSTIPKTGPFEGALYAFDATNGRQIWKIATNGGVQDSPSISNGVVYAAAYAGIDLKENVLAVDLKTGQQQWQHQIEKGLTTTPCEQDGVVYEVAGFDKGTLYALNASNGLQKWTLDIGAGPADLTIVA